VSNRKGHGPVPRDTIENASGTIVSIQGNLVRIGKITPDPHECHRLTIFAEVVRDGSHGRSLSALTKRQQEIALRLAGRESTREIAEALGITTHTVRRHIERIFAKLDVRSRDGVRKEVRRQL
jgi:DNA-binding CsgD family transcriptional regulator